MRSLRLAVCGTICLLLLAGIVAAHAFPVDLPPGLRPPEYHGVFPVDFDGPSKVADQEQRDAALDYCVQAGMDFVDANAALFAFTEYQRQAGAFFVDPNLEVRFAPASITGESLSAAVNALVADGLTNECTGDVLLTLADWIFDDRDPNAALVLADLFAQMGEQPGTLGATVTACQAFGESYEGWATVDGLTGQQCAERSLNSTALFLRFGFPAVVADCLQRTVIGVELDPCRFCPPQCCQKCDFSVPFDYNNDGITDADDLGDLTADWLAGL
jgi:hypothetical protein